ncbi:hypothetical protein [Rhodoplanes serenus]|uniref:hypothetical protein n=1 Tax=Rhodoplanes serenus TaxID=200615 RepID=UPI000DACB37E|nr:hypothetical protein [Rhodoplanes serenus]RAI34918.1 hypothetical protein CH340_07640 [Rhodoplanes serenus]
MRILAFEDDPVLSDCLKVRPGLTGGIIDHVATCADAQAALAGGWFDAVMLYVLLLDESG